MLSKPSNYSQREYAMSVLSRSILLGIVPVFACISVASADSKPEQIPALIDALSNANIRYGASLALTKLGAEAVPALRKSLATKNGDLPVWSAFTLGQIGSVAKPAVGDLTTALASSDNALRAAAAQALGKIRPSSSATVDALAKALKDENVQVRKLSAVALGQIGPSAKKSVAALIGTLHDSQVRKPVSNALIQIGHPSFDPLMKNLDNDKLRFDVVKILRKIDPEKAKRSGLDKATSADLTALRLVLFDMKREPVERTAAAVALASLGTDGVTVLVDAFQEKQIARTAAAAFAKVGPTAVPALIVALSHKILEVRATAADALGHIGPEASEAVAHLEKLLKDKDRNVRYRAVRALHNFGPTAIPAIPTLIDVMNNPKDSEPTRQWAIKTLVVTLPDTHDVVVKALIATSKDKNYGVSQLARQLVRQIDLKAAEQAGVK